MPTRPPHHVPSQESQNPHPPRVIPDPNRESGIREQSEALQIRLASGFAWGHKSTIAEGDSKQKPKPPKNAKQTQSTVPPPLCRCARPPFTQNKPNSTRPTPKLCETNPKDNRTPQACIHLYNPPVPPAGYLSRPRSIAPPQKTQNEPNLHRDAPVEDGKFETKPICPHARPDYAKRTQFQPRRTGGGPNTRNEPNLILSRASIWRNEPNPTRRNYETNPICPTTTLPHAKNAKRTQFPPGPQPKNAKRTQSQPPIIENEPNLRPQPPGPRPKCAKRTQFPTTNIHSTIYNLQSLGPNPARIVIPSAGARTYI